jgi:hypothetical protein
MTSCAPAAPDAPPAAPALAARAARRAAAPGWHTIASVQCSDWLTGTMMKSLSNKSTRVVHLRTRACASLARAKRCLRTCARAGSDNASPRNRELSSHAPSGGDGGHRVVVAQQLLEEKAVEEMEAPLQNTRMHTRAPVSRRRQPSHKTQSAHGTHLELARRQPRRQLLLQALEREVDQIVIQKLSNVQSAVGTTAQTQHTGCWLAC